MDENSPSIHSMKQPFVEPQPSAEAAGAHSVEEILDVMRSSMDPDTPWLWRDRWAD